MQAPKLRINIDGGHEEICDNHFCPCYQEGFEVLATSHWEMLVWIARRSPELLREALEHANS